jgi:hypothetical protein
MTNDEDSGADTRMDLQDASAILAEARDRARRELGVSRPPLFVGWGLVYLVAYGVIWLSVRGQEPYQGPTQGALAFVTIFVLLALAVTTAVVSRASQGVGGMASRQQRLLYLSFPIGLTGVFVLEAALRHAGASWAVIGVYGATAPMLVTGLIYLSGSVLDFDWTVFALGAWLITAAAVSSYTGPRTVWAAAGLTATAGFWLAAVLAWRRRS